MGSRGALYITAEKTIYAEGISVPVDSGTQAASRESVEQLIPRVVLHTL